MAKALSIEARLDLIEDDQKEQHKVLHGNGREGLVTQTARMEGAVKNMESSAHTIAVTATAIHNQQTKFVARTVKDVTRLSGALKAVGKTATSAHKRLKKVEDGLVKITDFKRSLIIRASTIGGIYVFLAGVLVAIWRYRHQLSELITK